MPDLSLFELILGFIVGLVAYAIIVRLVPGKQPLEEQIEALLDRVQKTQPAPAAPPPMPAPAAQIAPQAPIAAPVTPTPPPTTIERAMTQSVPVPPIVAPVIPEWPKDLVVNGVRALLYAPLSPLYRWSMMAATLGSQPGTRVADPSNAAGLGVDWPLRSPAGFPLGYAVTKKADGSLSYVGTPTVMFGDQAFNSDAEVLQYIRLTTRTPEQEAAIAAEWAKYDEDKRRQVAAAADEIPIEGA